MATACPPKEPLVAILGTTGTGKSDLAVDLALRFNGEIINADAMQMYKGLPVITNQLSPKEQRGVPHHLLASIDPAEPTWTVEVFAREASRLICEIRSRGRLPIVVGGTHYYIHALLFEDYLVSSQGVNDDSSQHRSPEENIVQFPILDGPTDLILERLREVDPDMADRWHPDDRRKIQRSLEIFLTTGKRASDIYAQQKQAKSLSGSASGPWQSLMFWVYTDPDVLRQRLDKRVDNMCESGLLDEVRILHESRRLRSEQGDPVNVTRGIWQSIGYKQMEPFLEAEKDGSTPTKINQLKAVGLEEMKIATRQYARNQLRWIRTKSIPAFKDHEAMDYLFLLNSSHAHNFSADVLESAARICSGFLHGQTLAKPTEISSTAKEVLTAFESRPSSVTMKVKTCELCSMTLQSDDQWQKHVNGRKHRRALQGKKRTALICLDQEEKCQVKQLGKLSALETNSNDDATMNMVESEEKAIHTT
ncbi:tRNA isopentenyltransferase [Annulohypoxylon truncatum]|uniref:tRNA isopentenyltransferase n=1 Tax=Annulohypoxylon truncatum TaxID=327061 RepID=UPI002008031B|nr:tRNA isopentenyltransferase [Annulohypoxylon truncatum]KAI1214574.1 tRNA isopentenyltransferase [Annulohypoxylon truncatum]